jgi:hypothetical protein
MNGFRRRLSWVLYTWLICQTFGLALPIALASTDILSVELCTCAGEDHGATCPMHHGHGQSSDDENRCSLQSAANQSEASLLSLAGGTGILPQPVALDTVQRSARQVALAATIPPAWTERPNSPPPRA